MTPIETFSRPTKGAAMRRLAQLGRRPWLAASLLAVTALALAAAVSLVRWPIANVHDEFSYLLAADTFSAGRLTNPAHPHWQHFETFHVIQQPSYASKYPPGQGVFLALGQRGTGYPIAGVWVLTALATVAVYWMQLGWTSPRWAAIGAALFLLHPGYQLVWGQSYWGGTLAFLGGALVFGAALRMARRLRAADACAMSIGAVLLATSRPFEGLVFCLLTGAWVLWKWISGGVPGSWSELFLNTAAPQAFILAIAGTTLGAYNHAVTGNAWTMPYQLHETIYGQCPLFHGQTPGTPEYRHAVIEQFHNGWAMDWYRRQATFSTWLKAKVATTWLAAEFFFSPVIAICLLLSRPWRWARLRPAIVIAGLALAISLVSIFSFPHYLAPVAPLLLMAAVAGLRRGDVLSRQWLAGFRLAPVIVALQACLFFVAVVNHSRSSPGWAAERLAVKSKLAAIPGKHLVFVRYAENHNPHQEWVYNHAEIDASRIVWARTMCGEEDAKLVAYFADRQAWLLEPEQRTLHPISQRDARGLAAATR